MPKRDARSKALRYPEPVWRYGAKTSRQSSHSTESFRRDKIND
jgi:hypothetical protein